VPFDLPFQQSIIVIRCQIDRKLELSLSLFN